MEGLVAIWLNQSDYRELRKLAQARINQPSTSAANALIGEWITEGACIRLAFLVVAMRFPDFEVPICYALCNAYRAILHEVNHARTSKGLTQQEIEDALKEMHESANEDMELSFLGFEEQSA